MSSQITSSNNSTTNSNTSNSNNNSQQTTSSSNNNGNNNNRRSIINKENKLRSFVWHFFDKKSYADQHYTCLRCSQRVRALAESTTTTLIYHLSKEHEITKKNYKGKLQPDTLRYYDVHDLSETESEFSSDDGNEETLTAQNSNLSNTNIKEINDKLLNFIISGSLPFSIAANDDFKALVNALNSQYKLPHTNTISKSLLMEKVNILL